jgi:hypothetical protein
MTTRVYTSWDASSPSLSGTSGSLIALLDACLVNGYGSKAAAGWTKPYTGTNVAAFRQGGGSMQYMFVHDALTISGGSKDASVCGMINMTSISAFDRSFPSADNSQYYLEDTPAAFGVMWRKSNTSDSVARDWILFADEKTVYMFIDSGLSTSPGYAIYGFGDFNSFVDGEEYPMFIAGHGSNEAGNLTSLAFVEPNFTLSNTYRGSYTASDVLKSKSASPCIFFHAPHFSEESFHVPGRFGAYLSDSLSTQKIISSILVGSSKNAVHGELRGIAAPSFSVNGDLKDFSNMIHQRYDEMPEISSSGGGFNSSGRHKVIPISGYDTAILEGVILINTGDWQ